MYNPPEIKAARKRMLSAENQTSEDSILVHVPFRMGQRASGSGIRPQKMIKAFESIGYQVDVVSGGTRERAARIKEIVALISAGKRRYKFCYSETDPGPAILSDESHIPNAYIDFRFLRAIKKHGIPIGLFYRDVFWRHPTCQKELPGWQWFIISHLSQLEYLLYRRLADVFFLPSLECLPDLPSDVAHELQPGHDVPVNFPRGLKDNVYNILHVGGVAPPLYDISPLLSKASKHNLCICCRERDWERGKRFYEHHLRGLSSVRITHATGGALEAEYARADFAAIIRSPHQYVSLMAPLKLFEAIGYNIPLLVSPGTWVSQFVESQQIGWVVHDSLPVISTEDYDLKVKNLLRIKKDHTWDARARKAAEILTA